MRTKDVGSSRWRRLAATVGTVAAVAGLLVPTPTAAVAAYSADVAPPVGTVWFTTTGFVDGGDGPSVGGPMGTVSRVVTGSLPTCEDGPFLDVPVTHAFCGQISWLVDVDVATGYADGTIGHRSAVERIERRQLSPHPGRPGCGRRAGGLVMGHGS